MTGQIQRVDTGLTVYGTQQVSYTVGAQTNVEFNDVVCGAAFSQVVAFEDEAQACATLAQARKRKLSDLGDALATFKRYNVFKNDADSGTKTEGSSDLRRCWDVLCNHYSIDKMSDLKPDDQNRMTKKQIMTAIQVVESEIDAENVELNQTSSMLQTIMSKRANAYSTATTLQRKLSNTADTLIRGMLN